MKFSKLLRKKNRNIKRRKIREMTKNTGLGGLVSEKITEKKIA